MVQTDLLFELSDTLHRFAWPLYSVITLWASILIFRSDRRFHSLGLLIGAGLWFLIEMGTFLLGTLPTSEYVRLHDSAVIPMEQLYSIRQLAILIAQGLICYGLLFVAIIQFRKSRLPIIEDDPTQ